MQKYRFDEHGIGYKVGKKLQSWRPQFSIIVSLVKEKSSVLDIGCGDGILAERLARIKKCKVVGIDLDETAVKELKRSGVKGRVHDIDEGIPFKNKSFDYVIMSDVLQYLKKPNFVISEALRVGKSFIVYFPNFGFWIYRLMFLTGKIPKLALFGHEWWESQLTRMFSYNDFLKLPSLKKTRIKKIVCINWANRKISFLAKFAPNFFGRCCVLEIEK